MLRLMYGMNNVRQRVTIAVAATIVLAAGLGLWADVPAAKAAADVQVESFTPEGMTGLSTNIAIKFSHDMVPKDSLNRPTTVIPVKITPDIAGLARWTATDILTIYPGQQLTPATEYRATVQAGGKYVKGRAIGENQEFRFRTPAFSAEIVRYQAQRSREQAEKVRLVFDLDFNYNVSRESLRRALRIVGRQGSSESRLSVIWPDTSFDGTQFPAQARQFRLATELFELRDDAQRYQLIIDRALRCVNCGSGSTDDYTYTMAVSSNPRLDLRVEQVRAERAGKQGAIILQFSSRIPTAEVREYISLDPAIPFTVEGNWRGVRLRGDFAPQSSYNVSVAPGMMSANGELMERGFSGRVIMGDLAPTLRFTSPGVYLPRDGNRLLEVSSVNIKTLSIEVSQVFANNLVTYMATGSDRWRRSLRANNAYGRTTFVKDFKLNSTKNEELLSTIDLGAIIGDTLHGVFLVSARGHSSRWISDSRHVMITDIGVMTRMSDDYLLVWANSLSETRPIGRATVKLLSRNNQLLMEGKTNSEGVAVFSNVAEQTAGYQPFIITVEKDGDLSYLRLDNSRLSTSDFDVSGRPYLTDGYEAFVYLDRGVFRPGETAHLVSMVRGKNGALPDSFRYRLKISDPRGRLFREYRLSTEQSMAGIDIELPVDIPTGKYLATVSLADNYRLGSTDFLVEDFVPDRIKVAVKTDQPDYLAGDTMTIVVNGQMLYGAPAANLKLKSEIILTPEAFRPTGFSKYSFGRAAGGASIKRIALGDTHLSDSGTARLQHVVGNGHRPPGMLSAQIWATVSELGGRTVSSFVEAKVYPYRRYVGLKTDLDGYAQTGKPINIDVVAVLPDGSPAVADSIQVRFTRIVYNSMLQKQPDGSYRYVSERTEEVIDSLWLSIGPDGSKVSFTPIDYGRYRITIRDVGSGHVAAVEFYAAGWGRVPWSMEEPDRLQLDLDQSEYAPGAVAHLQVRAPFGGRLLITVENQTVQDYIVLDLPDNTGEIELPIKREYAPNVYVSATLIRPASEISQGTPARAYGLVPVKVKSELRHLDVTVSGPEEIRPNSEISLTVNTTGSHHTRVTVAAVDIGIIQLTDFSTPDPYGFFYSKRRPALTGYDQYSFIYPETEPAASHLSPPGGVSGKRAKRHLNPFQARRIKVVSLWSGVLQADSNGNVTVDFKVPQFNGQLMIMAVASDGDRFGSSSSGLLVRQPIILQEGFPRFVAPDDDVRGLVTVFNGLDTSAIIRVNAAITGQASRCTLEPQLIRLDAGQQGVVEFPFHAGSAPGKIEVKLQAQAGSDQTEVGFELANRPASPLTTRFGSGSVTGDSAAQFTIPGDWVEGTAEYVLRTSSLSAVQMTRNIEYLLRYPYGCVEQTTSALFPLLYFDDLAKFVRPELLGGHGHEYFIAEGIQKLLRFQRSNGAFSYWQGSERIHSWSSIYAAHFLVEAKLAGYEIDDKGYKRTIRFLEDVARKRNLSDVNIEHRIYACLALAKAGKSDKKRFNFLADINTEKLAGYSRYQLASALALAGDLERAKEIVPFEIQPDLAAPESGGNFSSGVRSDAILLDLMLDIDANNPSTAVLAQSLLKRSGHNRWHNTQATAFALMALGKYFRRIKPAAFTGEITVEGGEAHRIDTAQFTLNGRDLGGRKISISIDGQGPCFYYWQVSGVPTNPDDIAYERGIAISREYLDASGKPVNLSRIPLGEQLVGHIVIKSTDRRLYNVVIADLLPAGFEIENTRLANTPTMAWLPVNQARPEHQDNRDDRLLLFTNLPAKTVRHFYYGLRAIAAGDFVVPPVAAECMYNPLVAGAGSPGRVTIVGGRK